MTFIYRNNFKRNLRLKKKFSKNLTLTEVRAQILINNTQNKKANTQKLAN